MESSGLSSIVPAGGGHVRARRLQAAKAAVAFLLALVVSGALSAVATPEMALADTASASSDGYSPAFTIEKLQKIDGVSGPFTSSPLVGKVGQTVDYEIVVKNTSPAGGSCEGSEGDASDGESDSTESTTDGYGCGGSEGDVSRESAFTSSSDGSCGCEGSEGDPSGESCGCERSDGELNTAFTFSGFGSDSCEGTRNSSSGEGGSGNTTLSFGALKDANCEGIAGGPGKALSPGESATYTCHHTLTGPGAFENTASVTASPPEGSPLTHSSNTVVANVAYEPAFTIEILQKIDGQADSFTSSPLSAAVGQKIDYEILVKNTGNIWLAFSNFKDSGCDAGTITGGPGKASVSAGAATTYLCEHVLSLADQRAGSYPNQVSIAGTSGEASAVTTAVSNTVVAAVPQTTPSPSPSPAPPPASSDPGPQSPPPVAATAAYVRGAGSKASPRGAVAAATALKGPSGCARSSFIASVSAGGVSSVTFSLDGRRLRTVTARNAHGSSVSVKVQVNRLAVGVHRLVAQIAMRTSLSPALTARTLTFLRCGPAVVVPRFTG